MTLPPIVQLEAFLATPQEEESLEALRQEYETVLTLLETHFLEAIISKDWKEFEEFVDYFRVEASTKSLARSGAGSFSQRPK
ncbi:MAG TPA: hypothetical protein V6D48_02015 [Oculatellaceae cyanobacterium]